MSLRLEKLCFAVESCVGEIVGDSGDALRVLDVGCDHAYLGIMLCERVPGLTVTASDIRPGPLAIAEKNIGASGFSDRIETVLTDGLNGFSAGVFDIIVISGMGAEQIAGILDKEPTVVRHAKRLVLSPHTKPEFMRYYARKRRLRRIGETAFFEEPRYYHIMTFEPSVFSGGEELFPPEFSGYSDEELFGSADALEIRYKISLLERNLEAMKRGGASEGETARMERELARWRGAGQ